MGRKFVVKTDHRPLVKLLGCNEPIPSLASTRIKKWAMMLAAYDYQIEYFAGKDNVYADFLSRQALTNVPPSDSEKVMVQVLLVESGEIVRAETVRKETANDPILAQVLRFVRNGWPMWCPVVQWFVQRFRSERLRVRSRRSATFTPSAHVRRQLLCQQPFHTTQLHQRQVEGVYSNIVQDSQAKRATKRRA